MVKFSRHIVSVVLVLCSFSGLAQDIHFSMFDMSPLTLNPANTGNILSDRRFSNIYRTQWKAIGKPLNTFSASYDQHLYFLPGNFSAGLVFVSDHSGGIDLIENKVMFSTAAKFYSDVNSISVGAQVGYAVKELSLKGTTFPEQYSRDLGRFDPNLFNGEYNYAVSTSYVDVNAGLLYTRLTQKGSFQIGAAGFHLNNPDDSFFKNGDGLTSRFSFNTKVQHRINDRWYIQPSLLVMTMSKAQDVVFNASAGIVMPPNAINIVRTWFGTAVRAGINRNGDAAIPMAGLEFKHFEVAAAYDFNFSDLKVATNNRGAFEVCLIYNSKRTAINRVMIPCDRF